jgi:hypothetical protein
MGERIVPGHYNDADREALRMQLLADAAATCPVHRTPIKIIETLSWRRNGAITEDRKQEGWPPREWIVRRASVRCESCGFVTSVLLELPSRASKPTRSIS